MRKASIYGLVFIAVTAGCLFIYLFSAHPETRLKISFLSVGQGDAIFIQAPNGRQMVIDGGPRGSLLKPLAAEMPEGDTSIDVIIVTNPDADHYAGFIDLLKTYSVGTVIESGTISTTKTYQEFESLVVEKHIPKLIATKGMKVVLDEAGEVTYNVLFPDRSLAGLSHNDASIVGRLIYGTTSVMLTGDSTIKTENFVIAGNKAEDLRSTIIKVGHHGSRTSTSAAFLDVVQPLYAVISAGKNNRYKHPHQETIDRLKSYGIMTLVTKDEGTVTFLSDGKNLERAK